MHLYENAERAMYAWNAVDVEVSGLLQHSHIIGLEEKPENDNTPSHLIVDFGGPVEHFMLVESGTVLDCSNYRGKEPREVVTVWVLLHDSLNRSWKWYPGKLLTYRFKQLHNMALVEVMIGGQCRLELLPHRQIRESSGDVVKPELLPVAHFARQALDVPNGNWPLLSSADSASEWLMGQVEQKLHLRVLTVPCQTKHYFRRRQVLLLTNYVTKNNELRAETIRKKLRSVGEDCLALPLEVLREVFHSLDTIDRQRCRRTCQLWDALLTSPELCREVHLTETLASSSLPAQWSSEFVLYACIFKLIGPVTRTMCFRGTSSQKLPWRLHGEALDLISKALAAAGTRLDRFIVFQRSIHVSSSGISSDRWNLSVFCTKIAASVSKLLPSCDRVIWKDCILTDKEVALLMKFRIPAAVFTPGHADAAHIADLLEQHLYCEGQPLKVRHITRFFAGHVDGATTARRVMQILEDFQHCDPPPSAHYRGRQWSADHVNEVDLTKVNRFCLYALSQHMSSIQNGSPPAE
ncbi:uncharacterized protein LOC129581080 [Paramacrobiotus metropolitanus]|uniref:uncharacterized protein LOC129581080 n=1 Tax=Paramacrobiotus metropolitanus TaxID=2943436 RepID=UPI0024458326|nr:uncharacterized protein LOC129581080 [Paramacrobiotus metropolitanus]